MKIYQLFNPGANSHYMFTIHEIGRSPMIVFNGYVNPTYVTVNDFLVMQR